MTPGRNSPARRGGSAAARRRPSHRSWYPRSSRRAGGARRRRSGGDRRCVAHRVRVPFRQDIDRFGVERDGLLPKRLEITRRRRSSATATGATISIAALARRRVTPAHHAKSSILAGPYPSNRPRKPRASAPRGRGHRVIGPAKLRSATQRRSSDRTRPVPTRRMLPSRAISRW